MNRDAARTIDRRFSDVESRLTTLERVAGIGGPEPDADALVRDHTRAELDALARDVGIDPDELPNKSAVAAAIVEGRR